MIADSLARQFLLKNKHIIRISVIEDDLGITGKSIYKWIIGKKPLPDRWNDPLFEYLYPMLDAKSKVHQEKYSCDKVVVVDNSHLLSEFQDVQKENLKKIHFSSILTKSADVIYFMYKNKNNMKSYLSIYSKYFSK